MRHTTIGAYGFSETAFFDALVRNGVTVLADVRRRRGVRGAEYAFVNRVRLEARLADLGIRYLHFLDLAPSASTRQIQRDIDEQSAVSKRARDQLASAFIEAYRIECLEPLSVDEIVARFYPDDVAAFFCVERDSSACHRSIVADFIESKSSKNRDIIP